MSVQIKTPTKHLFERQEFQYGDKTKKVPEGAASSPEDNGKDERKKQLIRERSATWGGGRGRKRRASERASGQDNRNSRKRFCRYGPRHSKIVLPTKFLLGGNISDPLNLNSMCDEEINRALNEKTPDSSPLPMPFKRHMVEVIIPANLSDPLNLNAGDDYDDTLLVSPRAKRKRSKYRHKKKSAGDEDDEKSSEPTSSALESRRRSQERKMLDAIVSPVIPQDLPKKRRKRTSSEGVNKSDQEDDKISPQKSQKIKCHRQSSGNTSFSSAQKARLQKAQRKNKKKKIYEYGNYHSYYQTPNIAKIEDKRFSYFKRNWFEGRDVLDIGCNVGHVTLSIARDFHPRRIIGLDIDGDLIRLAKKNVRHYISRETTGANKFPSAMGRMYGPIVGPPVNKKHLHTSTKRSKNRSYLDNVSFIQDNYVLESDDLLSAEREQYDVILVLSVTKWIHLNFGDSGMKRFFKRIYKQLRPGGRMILEPQSWASYKRKKKLTQKISDNYETITFRPEHFSEYLLSREVGFSTCEVISKHNEHKHKGFQRLVQQFLKPTTTYPTPYPTPWSVSQFNTPLQQHVYAQPPPIEATYVSTSANTPINLTPSLCNDHIVTEHMLTERLVTERLIAIVNESTDSKIELQTDDVPEVPTQQQENSQEGPSAYVAETSGDVHVRSTQSCERHVSVPMDTNATTSAVTQDVLSAVLTNGMSRIASAPALLESTVDHVASPTSSVSSGFSSGSCSECNSSQCDSPRCQRLHSVNNDAGLCNGETPLKDTQDSPNVFLSNVHNSSSPASPDNENTSPDGHTQGNTGQKLDSNDSEVSKNTTSDKQSELNTDVNDTSGMDSAPMDTSSSEQSSQPVSQDSQLDCKDGSCNKDLVKSGEMRENSLKMEVISKSPTDAKEHQLQKNAPEANEQQNNAPETYELQDNSAETGKLPDKSTETGKLQDNSAETGKLQDKSPETGRLQDNSDAKTGTQQTDGLDVENLQDTANTSSSLSSLTCDTTSGTSPNDTTTRTITAEGTTTARTLVTSKDTPTTPTHTPNDMSTESA